MLQLSMIIGGIVLRLVPHLPNFSSITATALFGGTYLKKRYALLVPLLAIAISDYLLLYVNPFGNPVVNTSQIFPLSAMFHGTTAYVWSSFVITGLIGLWLRKNPKPSTIITASLLASLQFYLITNFGVWASGMYSRSLDGLLMSYVMGLPFLRWTMLGDLFYTIVFFGTYAFSKRTQPNTNTVTVVTTRPE